MSTCVTGVALIAMLCDPASVIVLASSLDSVAINICSMAMLCGRLFILARTASMLFSKTDYNRARSIAGTRAPSCSCDCAYICIMYYVMDFRLECVFFRSTFCRRKLGQSSATPEGCHAPTMPGTVRPRGRRSPVPPGA